MDFVFENIKNERENLKFKLFMNLFKPISYVGLGITHFLLSKTYYLHQSKCAITYYLTSKSSFAAKKT